MSFNNNKNESHLDKQLHRNTQTKVHPSLHHAKIYKYVTLHKSTTYVSLRI